MRFIRAIRLSIRAKVLILALGLALPPLITVSLLGLSNLDTARLTANETLDAIRDQAETNLAKRASDKAILYDTTLHSIEAEVESVAAYARVMIDSGPPPASTIGRVWISPNGPTPQDERRYAESVARGRQFSPFLNVVVQRHPLVSLGYIAQQEGGVTTFDHDIVDTLNALKPFEIRTRTWYISASAAGRTVWVDPYIDANSKKLTLTCATPINDSRGQFIGVVGFDVLLETIEQDILKLDLGEGGYAFLINQYGNVMVHPALEVGDLKWNDPFISENMLATADPKLRSVIERMIRGERGVERVFYQDQFVYLAYAPIETAGWSVGMIVPEEEVIRPATAISSIIGERQSQLRSQVVVVFGSSMVAVLIIGSILSVVLTRPLLRLQAGAQRLAAGDLNHRLPQTSSDEIGELVHSFNTMADSLRQKIAELEDNLRQLATLNVVSNRFKAILSLPELTDAIPHAVCEGFGFERAVLYLIDGNALYAVGASFGPGAEEQAAKFIAVANTMPITIDSETVEADIIRSGQAVIVNNPWEHPRVIQAKQQISRSESYVQVPIFGREEKIIGLLSADYHYSRRAVAAHDAAQLLTFASMAGLTLENTRLYNDLERQVSQRTTELRAAFERAQEADRLKGQFLAAISHELRTPLNAIIGFSTVMLDELDGPISPMQREDLKTINQNGRFLLHLINELLDLARIDSGKLELDLQPIDLAALIAEVSETVQGLLRSKKVVLQMRLHRALPPARADFSKVRQILLNLLSNAVKFTHEGSVTISARCVVMSGLDEAHHGGDRHANGNSSPPVLVLYNGRQVTPYIAVSVQDTGIGIAAEHLPMIFEEFRQVRQRDSGTRGSGLGLSIVRKLVEAHGGRIWVESIPGQGSTFTFTLPCHVAPNPTEQPADVSSESGLR